MQINKMLNKHSNVCYIQSGILSIKCQDGFVCVPVDTNITCSFRATRDQLNDMQALLTNLDKLNPNFETDFVYSSKDLTPILEVDLNHFKNVISKNDHPSVGVYVVGNRSMYADVSYFLSVITDNNTTNKIKVPKELLPVGGVWSYTQSGIWSSGQVTYAPISVPNINSRVIEYHNALIEESGNSNFREYSNFKKFLKSGKFSKTLNYDNYLSPDGVYITDEFSNKKMVDIEYPEVQGNFALSKLKLGFGALNGKIDVSMSRDSKVLIAKDEYGTVFVLARLHE